MSEGGGAAASVPRGRLRWLCRRGTRELDILLTRFLETSYDHLDETGRSLFRHLLEQPDPDLLAWFTGQDSPPDRALRDLVVRIAAGPDHYA